MDRSQSRYFTTAAKMDDAFLALLEKKDFTYITVKEICLEAGVSRSTFYLHYETINDLLIESVERMNKQFLAFMQKDARAFLEHLETCAKDELFLVTPQYLVPYLHYVKKHMRLFKTATQNANVLRLDAAYERLFHHVFAPILERYQVPQSERPYVMTFFIRGLMAVVEEWLARDCADPIEKIVSLIQKCVPKP